MDRKVAKVDMKQRSRQAALSFEGQESKVRQEFKDECDINTIVKRFGLTGQVPVSGRQPAFGEFFGPEDYRAALDAVREAQEAFQQLPGAVRRRFGDRPEEFLAFLEDDGNRAEAEALGLVEKASGPLQSPSPQEPPKEA